MSTTALACEVRGVHQRYGAASAIHDINFSVSPGSVVALVGPLGSGKTTLTRILLGLRQPTAGTVFLGSGGRGGVLQPRGLHPRRSIRAHLRALALAAQVDLRRVHELLETTELTECADRSAGQLTPGQRTRGAVAGALLTQPRLLVLDEPLTDLDPQEQTWLCGLLRAHARRGGAVVLTASSLAQVLPMADRLIVLNAGAIVYHGSPSRLRRKHPDRLIVAASAPDVLATALAARGFTDAVIRHDGRLAVAEARTSQITEAAAAVQVRVDNIAADPIHPDRVLASLTRPQLAPTMPTYGVPQ